MRWNCEAFRKGSFVRLRVSRAMQAHQRLAPSTSGPCRRCNTERGAGAGRSVGRGSGTRCAAVNELASVAAGISPTLMQDVLVGGAVIGTVGFALTAGLRKEQVVCDLCQGTGGTRCFVCGGDGKTVKNTTREPVVDAGQNKRDALGRAENGRNCRVCKGAGLIGCSKCRGSGYMNA